jgi:hypothetical protein
LPAAKSSGNRIVESGIEIHNDVPCTSERGDIDRDWDRVRSLGESEAEESKEESEGNIAHLLLLD